jgi:hypothetical protein
MDKAGIATVRRQIRRILRQSGGKFLLRGKDQQLVEEIGRLQRGSKLPVKAFGKLIGLSSSQASYVNEKFRGQRKPKRLAARAAARAKIPRFSEIRIAAHEQSEPVEVRTPGGYVLRFSSSALAAEFIRRCEQGGSC